MVPHHRQAVELADLAPHKAAGKKVERLETQIKGAQEPETRTMSTWLSSWGVDPAAPRDHSTMDHSGMDTMDGMSGDRAC